MKVFSSLTDTAFKKGTNGQLIYYPWGVLSHGYEIPNEAIYQACRSFLKTNWILLILFILVVSVFSGWDNLLFWLLLIPLVAFHFIRVRQLTRGLNRSNETMSLAMEPVYWILGIVCLFALLVMAFFFVFYHEIALIPPFVITGLGLIACVYKIIRKHKR